MLHSPNDLATQCVGVWIQQEIIDDSKVDNRQMLLPNKQRHRGVHEKTSSDNPPPPPPQKKKSQKFQKNPKNPKIILRI